MTEEHKAQEARGRMKAILIHYFSEQLGEGAADDIVEELWACLPQLTLIGEKMSWIKSKVKGLDCSGKLSDVLARMTREQAEVFTKELQSVVDLK